MDRLDVTLDSRLEEIERLAEEVDGFCERHDLPPRVAFQFNLCFDELITNIVSHGLAGLPTATIAASVSLEDGWLWGEVADEGPAFDPFTAAEPDLTLSVEDRPIGGLGVHFLRTVMDEAGYERRDGRNQIRFGKSLAGSDD